MNQKALLGFALVLLAGAGFGLYHFLNKPSAGTQNMEFQTAWVCFSPACGKDFEMTAAEFVERRVKGTSVVPCEHCGEIKTGRALKCPDLECGRNNRVVGHGNPSAKCAHCGGAMMGP